MVQMRSDLDGRGLIKEWTQQAQERNYWMLGYLAYAEGKDVNQDTPPFPNDEFSVIHYRSGWLTAKQEDEQHKKAESAYTYSEAFRNMARERDAALKEAREWREIAERLRAERDKFERAWNDVSSRYEALLNQLGASDA